MAELVKCSVCGDKKPISEYYLNKNGKRRGAKCKPCNNKTQYQRNKVNPKRIKYIEDNKEIRYKRSKESYERRKHTPEFKELRKRHQYKYRKTDAYKEYIKELNERSRINPHIKELNKQLRAAKAKDKQRTIEANKEAYYSSIADKYTNKPEALKEEWKDVKGYEGRYRISNYGEVYSCISNKTLNKVIGTYGYYQVNLHKDNKQSTQKIHILVGKYFVINNYNKDQLNHKDFNKLNNRSDNLEWVTAKENSDHKNACIRGMINATS